MSKRKSNNFSIIKSKFTLKIILLTVLPIMIVSAILLSVLFNQINKLNNQLTDISTDMFDDIYYQKIMNKNIAMKDTIFLQLDSILNELNILRADAQELIDRNPQSLKLNDYDYSSWVQQYMAHNYDKNWSNLTNNNFNVSISVWGYLHNKDGSINEETENYISLMSPIIPLLHSVGENGAKKGWYYVVGPKQTPIMIMTPWAQMPQTFDELYPGHNEQNWWDFFFPGIIESWQEWILNKNNDLISSNEQVTLTPLYRDAGGTGLMVTFFAPLWSKDRTQNFGAAALDYNISDLTNILNDEYIGNDDFTFLLQSNGNIIDASNEIVSKLELSQKESLDTGVDVFYFNLKSSKISDLAAFVDKMSDMNTTKTIEFSSDNEQFLLAYKKLTDYNMWDGEKIVPEKLYVVSVISKKELLTAQNKIYNEITVLSSSTLIFIIILSLLLAMTSITFSILYALRSTKQIRLISQGLSQIGEKNYDVCIDIISNDELGNLANTFNKITKELSEAYKQLNDYTLELEEKIKERTVHLKEANQKLEQLSQIDGLTKIYNRRYFDVSIEKRWREYSDNYPISIIMIDIDYFKKYNDYYGHQSGDACLSAVASTLLQQINGSNDMVARYGGEEFVVIACIDKEDATELAQKLRLAVKELSIEHKLSEKGIVTISLGVASIIPSQSKTISGLIKTADIALYESKHNGRDMVSLKVYED